MHVLMINHSEIQKLIFFFIINFVNIRMYDPQIHYNHNNLLIPVYVVVQIVKLTKNFYMNHCGTLIKYFPSLRALKAIKNTIQQSQALQFQK